MRGCKERWRGYRWRAAGIAPVVSARLDAPADELDSVAACHLAGGVLVNARLVGLEVSVDGERDRLRPVGHEVLHDLGGAADGVRAGSLDLVSRVGGRVLGVLLTTSNLSETSLEIELWRDSALTVQDCSHFGVLYSAFGQAGWPGEAGTWWAQVAKL